MGRGDKVTCSVRLVEEVAEENGKIIISSFFPLQERRYPSYRKRQGQMVLYLVISNEAHFFLH